MADIVQRPPFLLTYWNPLAKDSNLIGSWFDYVKDVSLAKYTADSVGRYVQQASANQISAVESTGRKICGALFDGFSGLRNQLSEISGQLGEVTNALQGVNQRLDLALDAVRMSNLLQENMAKLLRIPESEKQRQHHIEMGLKFLQNALKDEDLYQDALRELIEAEKLMPSDYFVLHRIGMIYLYVPALGNLVKAFEYFNKAAKYSLVESHPDAARLSNILKKNIYKRFAEQVEPTSAAIGDLAAESYHQAGTTLYALGRFQEAAKAAENAVKCQPSEAKYHFFLAKYMTRSGSSEAAVFQLQRATELAPAMALAAIGDYDLNQVSLILDLLNRIDAHINAELLRGVGAIKDWPKGDHRYADVQQWVKDAQSSLEKGDYVQKRLLTSKLIEFEPSISFAPKLAKMATFGVEFNRNMAEQFLRENNPDRVQQIWIQRRKHHAILDERIRNIAGQQQSGFIENILLATAGKSYFATAGNIRWTMDRKSLNYSIATSANAGHTISVMSDQGILILDRQSLNALKQVKASTGRTRHRYSCTFGLVFDIATSTVNGSSERVFGWNEQTGKCIWQLETGGFINQDLVFGPTDIVYIISQPKTLYALNGRTGNKIWDFTAKSSLCVNTIPAIGADGTVYVGMQDRTLYAFEGQTGEKLWEFSPGGGARIETDLVIGFDGTIYFGSGNKAFAIWTASPGPASFARKAGKSVVSRNKTTAANVQKSKLKRLIAEARTAEKVENAKWLRKKDFSRARELYTQAAALGSKEASTKLEQLPS